MRPRHLSLLSALLLTCIASAASAQHLQSGNTPTHVVVKINGTFTWTANEIRWSGSAPTAIAPRLGDVRPAEIPARAGNKPANGPASNTVEIIAVSQSSDASWNQWAHAASTSTPAEVTISLVNVSGSPIATYLLHGAVVTKVSMNQMDAGAGQIPLTHVTMMAQSITMAPTGQ